MQSNPENVAHKDLYKRLGVTREASLQDIKKAFNRLALRWHPDKNESNEATQMFTNIRYAYEVLANNQTRIQYDESGDTGDDFNIAGILESFGKRLSDEYKILIKEKIQFYENHKFFNNCDIENEINSILNKKNNFGNPIHQRQRQNSITEQVRKLIFVHNSFIEWPKIFSQVDSTDQNSLRMLYKQLVPDKKLLEGYNKSYVSQIYVLQALILKAEQLPIKCLSKLEQVALFLPCDEIQQMITTIISEINFRKLIRGALNLQNVMIDLKIPQKLFYGQSLQMNKILNLIKKYDKQISSMQILEGAYTYIDLCRALRSPVSIFGCLTMSCIKFLQYIKKASDKQKYAYCKLINNIALQIVVISMKYFTPSLHLYGLKIALTILINSNRQMNMINTNYQYYGSQEIHPLADEKDIKAIYTTAESIQRMYSICPFSAHRIYRPFDVIYVDVILRRIVTRFLENMEVTDDQLIPYHLASYYLFEGIWQGQYDSKFQFRRFDCMVKFLENKKWGFQKLQQILKWPLLKRQEGWISEQSIQLQLKGTKFNRFDGFTMDFQTGEIQLLMTQCSDQNPETFHGLFTNNDIQDIFSKGISGSFFTLEAPDDMLQNHPFQEFRYAPESISRTNYFDTLLHADYLLKMFTTGVQINAQAPYEFKDISQGLTKRLPKELKEKITLPQSNVLGQAHRFWIQAGQVPYLQYQEQNKQKLTILYGQVKMKVKTHLLKRNLNGELVDDDDDDDDDKDIQLTAEKKFVKNFTEYYNQIGLYYPVLLRLKQLVKISGAYNQIKTIYKSLKKQLQNRQNCQKRVREHLSKIRSIIITFPINTTSLRNKLFQETLVKNRVLQNQVAFHQISRVKNEIYSHLQKEEIDLINNIKDGLIMNYKAIINDQDIRAWLSYGSTQLQNKLINTLHTNNLKKLAAFQESLSKFKTKLNDEQVKKSNDLHSCVWVPAVFKKDARSRRVYGGVALPLSYKQVNGSVLQQLAKKYPKVAFVVDYSMQAYSFVSNLNRVDTAIRNQIIRQITKPVNNLISYFGWNKKNNSETHNSGPGKQSSYITVYRSKFQGKREIGAEVWHASVHVVINGKPEIWEYGRYDGINGKLRKRESSKKQDGQSIITSCKINKPLTHEQFVKFSTDYCKDKSWGFGQSFRRTNCQYYALRVLQKFTTPECAALMDKQISKNLKEAVQQAASHYAKQTKTTIQNALQIIMDLLIPRAY